MLTGAIKMNVTLKLNVDQIATAIFLLDQPEKEKLKERLPSLFALPSDATEELGWLYLVESGFEFWEEPAEDLYNDLIPVSGLSNEILKLIAHATMTALDQQRLDALLYTQNRGELTPSGEQELAALMAQYGRTMLRRAKAVALLSARGISVSSLYYSS